MKRNYLRLFCGCLALTFVTSMSLATVACSSGQKLASIRISPASPSSLQAGLTLQFTATAVYSDGSNKDVTSKAAWTSSDISVASISSDGLASGLAKGNIDITASFSGMTSPGASLAVVTLSSIAITPSPTPDVAVDSTQEFIATGTFSDGSTAEITSRVTWSSSDTNIFTVSSVGITRGVVTGAADLTATMSDVTSPAARVTVVPVVLLTIAITPANPDHLTVGLTRQFTASGAYSDGSTKDVTSQVTWSSSNTGVATISSAGVTTGVATGTTYINASLAGIAAPTVRLQAANLSSISVTTGTSTPLVVGSARQFGATGAYSDGTVTVITSLVSWASSDTKVATIGSAGSAFGVSPGNTSITATLAGVTSPGATLTVATLTSITVTTTFTDSLGVGAIRQFTATAAYSNGATADVTTRVTWTSSNVKVATIASTGAATAVAVGNTSITASMGGVTGNSIDVTVVP